MKQSQVRPGTVAMLSLKHRGAVRVTVRYERTGLARLNGKATYVCVDSSGTERVVSARQLQPMPHVAAQSQLIADYTRHLDRLIAAKGARV